MVCGRSSFWVRGESREKVHLCCLPVDDIARPVDESGLWKEEKGTNLTDQCLKVLDLIVVVVA